MDTVLDLHDQLFGHIRMMADMFPDVFVPCVVGNHGRLDKKPSYKNAAFDNFEYLLYQMLQRSLASVENVKVDVAESTVLQYGVYGYQYRMEHGMDFRGGNGIGGVLVPILRGDAKRCKSFQYDYLIMGHFHQYIVANGVIVNGSLKGYDEYAIRNGFPYEQPAQALWLTHPEMGMTISMPVYSDEDVRFARNSNLPPIAPPKDLYLEDSVFDEV